MTSKRNVLISAAAGIVVILIVWYWANHSAGGQNLDEFAKCLNNKEFIMYGSVNCAFCRAEKAAFGSSFRFIKHIECTETPELCAKAGIQRVPTWILPGGKTLEGRQGLQKLSEVSGCPLPANN